ncbi:GtrA family protein [Pseudonocardia sediminis]|uniref:GtrA family protein n=1 Tax=Pseudonocardia sediminis TaxID=1397368 RepID=UPI001F5E87A5|nr:GtrA family protein [Pseudonocardia sediminis]
MAANAIRDPATVPTRSERARRSLGRLIRYGMVGVANAAVYYATYRLVLEPVGYLAAHALGLAVAMVVSYFLHCRFTFSVRPTWRRFLRFPSSQAVNIAATTVGVVALVHLGVGERVAPLAAAIVAVPVTFLLTTVALTGRRSARTTGPVSAGH